MNFTRYLPNMSEGVSAAIEKFILANNLKFFPGKGQFATVMDFVEWLTSGIGGVPDGELPMRFRDAVAEIMVANKHSFQVVQDSKEEETLRKMVRTLAFLEAGLFLRNNRVEILSMVNLTQVKQ